MIPGPVFNMELLTLARRGRYFLLRTFYGALLLFFIWTNMPSGYVRADATTRDVTIQDAARIGESLFLTFVITQSFAVFFLTPALVAGSIADERQRKTLHYLLASRLSSAEIVLGKLFARGLHLTVFLAAGLPILVMISLFGGVDPNIVLLWFAGSFTSAYFLAGLSILASTQASRPREAVSMSYIGAIAWLFGPSLYLSVLPNSVQSWARPAFDALHPVVEWIGWSSPIHVMTNSAFRTMRGLTSSPLEMALWMMGLQLAFGTLLSLWAVLRIRPLFRREGSRRRPGRAFQRLMAIRFLKRSECGDDAMLWKERHVSRTSPMMRVVTALAFLLVLGLLVYNGAEIVADAAREFWSNGYSSEWGYGRRAELNVFLRIVMTLLGVCVLLGTASTASSTLTSEREEDTWISLISTPLTAGEILRAKWFGAIWSLRAVLATWGAMLLLGLVLGAIHPFGAVASIAFLGTYTAFAATLGVFWSLWSRTSPRALLATVGTLLTTNVGYLLLVLSLVHGFDAGYFVLVGVCPYFLAVSPMSYQDLANPRSISLELFQAGYASLFVHGVAALVLALISVSAFDHWNDRPRGTTTSLGDGVPVPDVAVGDVEADDLGAAPDSR